jgi:hypothetical protein
LPPSPSQPITTESKPFFFEKKNQKTFASPTPTPASVAPNGKKFFAAFLQKRSPSPRP